MVLEIINDTNKEETIENRLDEREMETIREMSGFGASYYEEGIIQGMNQGILQGRSEGLSAGIIAGKESNMIECINSLVLNLGLTTEEAMNALSIPLEEQDKYLKILK